MLLQKAEFADARQLTASLWSDPSHWSATALRDAESVAHDTERTARLLAGWADVLAAALGYAPAIFAAAPSATDRWVQRGQAVMDASCRGQAEAVYEAAVRCATELTAHERALLLEYLSRAVSSIVDKVGSFAGLLELDSLHQLAAGSDELWVSAGAWMVGALTEMNRHEMQMRLVRLVGEDGRAPDLWRMWLQVAATVIPEAAVHGFAQDDLPPQAPADYPKGFVHEAVLAAHSENADRLAQAHAGFEARSRETQVFLVMSLAMMIATFRRLQQLPQDAAVAAEHQQALEDRVATLMDALPDGAVERTGRMHAFARRAVLAYMDKDAPTLAAVVERIATWDSEPGHIKYPDPAFKFPAQQALRHAADLLSLGLEYGFGVSHRTVTEGAIQLVNAHAPAEHRDAARDVLTAMRRNGLEKDLPPDTFTDAAGFLAAAACGAWLASNKTIFKAPETVRLSLIKEIRESEAKALRIPEREQVLEVSDDEALALLQRMYGEGYPLPRDPAERALVEMDIVAVIKQHLLEVPADATTPEQFKALDAKVKTLLSAVAGTPQQAPKKQRAPGTVRKQPRRQPKRNRKRK
ncbi:hypothetical protein ACIBUY_04025 [Streptomyces sp. NPDC050085]|uniref:hypothetical protein n=1 Tax=Streptomyces sp. NPDC050085 TaxID=3365600 RepID=UPI0037B417AD